jgi:ABC-type amino acid transport substrate-binding protein
MRLFCIFILAVLTSCGCGSSARSGSIRVGVDPTWAPLSFDALQPYVNGYTDEVLQEISRFSGLEIEKVETSWDMLLNGLTTGKYDVVLCSLPPYNFNQAKYDFGVNYLELGPVLIIPANANYSNLREMNGELVGVITGDPAVLVVEKFPDVIIRNYTTIQDVLNAVAKGEIEAAVIDRLPASNYVHDLYAGKLKIASAPMSEVGLHAVTLKGHSARFMKAYNHGIEQLKKKKAIESLEKKWSL